MQDASPDSSRDTDADTDFVEFLLAGVHAKGEFHCAECGYGITIYRELPVCPMCGNESWEQTAWSPFGRALRAQ
jgi:hypothetical protein